MPYTNKKRWLLIGGLGAFMIALVILILFASGGAQPAEAKSSPRPVWVSASDISNAPSSGDEYDNMATWAAKTWTVVDGGGICNQDNQDDAIAVAKALYSVKNSDATMQAVLETQLAAVANYKQFEDTGGANDSCEEVCEEDATVGVGNCDGDTGDSTKYRKILNMARNSTGYIVAADIIGYDDQDFIDWVEWIIPTSSAMTETETYFAPEGPRGLYKQLYICNEKLANNWGAHCGAAMMAGNAYLRATEPVAGKRATIEDEMARVDNVLRAFVGNPLSHPLYPAETFWREGARFDYPDEDDGVAAYWTCDDSLDPPEGINDQPCVKTYTETVGHVDPLGKLADASAYEYTLPLDYVEVTSVTVAYYDARIETVGVFVDNVGRYTQIRFGIYDSEGTEPGDLIAETAATTLPVDTEDEWFWVDLTSPVTLTKSIAKDNWSVYWLALHIKLEINPEDVVVRAEEVTGAGRGDSVVFSSGLPDPWDTENDTVTNKHINLVAIGEPSQTIDLRFSIAEDVARCSREFKPVYPGYPDVRTDYPFLGPVCRGTGEAYPYDSLSGLGVQDEIWQRSRLGSGYPYSRYGETLGLSLEFEADTVGLFPEDQDLPTLHWMWARGYSEWDDPSLPWPAEDIPRSGLGYYDWLYGCPEGYSCDP